MCGSNGGCEMVFVRRCSFAQAVRGGSGTLLLSPKKPRFVPIQDPFRLCGSKSLLCFTAVALGALVLCANSLGEIARSASGTAAIAQFLIPISPHRFRPALRRL